MRLEVIAETVEDAQEAEQGGAGRIELVRELDRGGMTPPLPVVEAVVKAVRIPVRVMIRESDSFVAAPGEARRLQAAAREVLARGAAGVVAGFLRDGAPDLPAVREMLGALSGPVTFHRAFDDTTDPLQALAALAVEPRVDRLLTSGAAGDWPARLARLIALRQAAPPHLTILPGGGLDAGAVRDLAARGFPEAHVGRAARLPSEPHGRVRADRVAGLVAIIRQTAAPHTPSNPA